MSWVDIVIIALMGLCALFGVFRGVKKSLLSTAAFVLSLVIAFFLSKVVAEALLGIEGVRNFVLGNGEHWSLYKWLFERTNTVLPSDYLNSVFYQPVTEIISAYPGYTTAFTLEKGRAVYYAFMLFSAICGVGIYLVSRLILSIATVIIKSFIGKHKSGVSRLFGFVFGAGHGFLWAMLITLLFTMIGGFTFVSFINTVETEYEQSVVAKTVYDWAYVVRNKVYLPDKDMYARVVDRSGLNIIPDEDEGEGEDAFPLSGAKLDIYVDFINFNYGVVACTVTDGKPSYTDDYEQHEYNAADYESTGFHTAFGNILEYNASAVQRIYDGALNEADNETLELYKNTLKFDEESIYDLLNSLKPALDNYKLHIEEANGYTDPALKADANADLEQEHDAIAAILDKIAERYAKLALLGALDLGEYPAAVVVE